MGGMETHVEYLAADLHRRGISVGVALPTAPAFDDSAARCTAAGIDVIRADTDTRDGRLAQVKGLQSFVRWASRRHPDVVHLHTGGATGGLAAALATRLLVGTRLVRTEHDVPAPRPRWPMRISSWCVDRLCQSVVAVSNRNAGLRAGRLRAPARSAVVLNGVPLPGPIAADCHSAIRRGFDIPDDAVVIGSVVRLADGKGLPDLLAAFSQLPRTVDTHLLLVGDGPLRRQLEASAGELGIAARVHFAGYQKITAPFYAAMDIFCLAVPAGSMSIALLEAMAHGIPSVITFGGPEEAVIHEVTGLTSPPNDAPALACTLGRLQADPGLRARLGAAGRNHISTNLSSERVANDLIAVYTAAVR
jgi:glycosyltransferase involved in cell wall biosynthesis